MGFTAWLIMMGILAVGSWAMGMDAFTYMSMLLGAVLVTVVALLFELGQRLADIQTAMKERRD